MHSLREGLICRHSCLHNMGLGHVIVWLGQTLSLGVGSIAMVVLRSRRRRRDEVEEDEDAVAQSQPEKRSESFEVDQSERQEDNESWMSSRVAAHILLTIIVAALLSSVWSRGLMRDLLTTTKWSTEARAACEAPSGKGLVNYYSPATSLANSIYEMKIMATISSSSSSSSIKASGDVEKTQALFNEGMQQFYGFNQIEARRNFEAAIEVSNRTCAMCFWGLSVAYGPNINSALRGEDYMNSRNAILEASDLLQRRKFDDKDFYMEDAHMDLVQAQLTRCAAPSIELWKKLGQGHFDGLYVTQMEKLANKYPDDVNIQVLWIDAVVLLTPWEYYEEYSPQGGEKLKKIIAPAYAVLQRLVDVKTPHLLALHLWIHITEQSTNPNIGLKAADDLAQIIQDDGTSHLIHMPCHIYFRTGRYEDCLASSKKAVEVDEIYKEKCLEPYLPTHNKAMLVACSLASGKDVHHVIQEVVLPSYQVNPLSAIWPSAIFPPPLELVYARFGKWEEILSLPTNGGALSKSESSGTPYLRSQSLYAHILATLWSNRSGGGRSEGVNEIESMRINFAKEIQNIAEDSLPIHHVFYPYHREIGQLLNLTLLAAFQMKDQNYENARNFMEIAVQLQDSFTYMEPENHYIPLRQCLAAVLMESCNLSRDKGTCERAGYEYEEDLRIHPQNVWSAYGLNKLEKLGSYQSKVFNHTTSSLGGTDIDIDIKGSCCELNLC